MDWIRLPDCSKSAVNQKNDDDIIICRYHISLVLDLWQILFIRDWTRNLEIEDTCLNFAQYLMTGASYWNQIYHGVFNK